VLAWVQHRGPDVVPIPGTKRRTYLEENTAAVAVTLSAEDLAEIEAAVPEEAVHGARYPSDDLTLLGR
jgi:aryl-alcohol dehydrogenase-like predicted oxidoreductase